MLFLMSSQTNLTLSEVRGGNQNRNKRKSRRFPNICVLAPDHFVFHPKNDLQVVFAIRI